MPTGISSSMEICRERGNPAGIWSEGGLYWRERKGISWGFRALHDQRLAAGPRQGQRPLTREKCRPAFFPFRTGDFDCKGRKGCMKSCWKTVVMSVFCLCFLAGAEERIGGPFTWHGPAEPDRDWLPMPQDPCNPAPSDCCRA